MIKEGKIAGRGVLLAGQVRSSMPTSTHGGAQRWLLALGARPQLLLLLHASAGPERCLRLTQPGSGKTATASRPLLPEYLINPCTLAP